MQFTPYLNFDGDCQEAFTFYEQILGGKIVAMFTHGNTPAAGSVSAEWQDKIMHARLRVGDAELMGSDSPPEYFSEPQGLRVSLNLEEPAEADRIFHVLSEGGTVLMPIQETFWALRFAMFTDRFGIPWMINCEKPF